LHRERDSYREWIRTNIYKPLKITIMDDKKKERRKLEDDELDKVSGGASRNQDIAVIDVL